MAGSTNLLNLSEWMNELGIYTYLLEIVWTYCSAYDPAEGYKVVFTSSSYEEAQLWLLEDEYEPIEGRVSAFELE